MEQSKQEQLSIKDLEIRKADHVIRVLAHDLRLNLLRFINEKKEATVTTIYTALHIEQPIASLNLSELRKTGFVNTRRDGKSIYYSVNYDRLNKVQNFISELLNNKKEDTPVINA